MQKNRERLQFNNRTFSNNLDNEDTVGRDDDEGNNDDDCLDLLKWCVPVHTVFKLITKYLIIHWFSTRNHPDSWLPWIN